MNRRNEALGAARSGAAAFSQEMVRMAKAIRRNEQIPAASPPMTIQLLWLLNMTALDGRVPENDSRQLFAVRMRAAYLR